MTKLLKVSLATSLVAGVFLAGVAVGKTSKDAKFLSRDEVKWDDVGGPKLGTLTGDHNKGPYMGLLQIPQGFASPMHSHSGDYEAVQIEGTSTHWFKGEDGKSAKKMTPGSYWTIPAKVDHISQCEKGKDCVMLVIQKTKFDFAVAKDEKAGSAAPKK